MLKAFESVRAALREGPDRIRTALTLSHQSGLLWALSPAGALELARVVGSGAQNPSVVFKLHAVNTPSKPALIFRGRTFSWKEIDDRIDRFASGLVRHGIGKKQSVIVMMRNRPEAIELGAAAARAGAATVAISWRSTAKELTYLANHSGARGIAIEPDLLPVLEQAKSELSEELLKNVFIVGSSAPPGMTALDSLLEEAPRKFAKASASEDDAAVVIYTSGTTGKPKGAVRKFPKDTMQAASRFMIETPMRVDDVHIAPLPLYHTTAFGFITLSYILGATVVLLDEFKPETFLETVQRYRVTTAAVVPTMLHRILELPAATRQKYDARSLRAVFTTGAPLPGPLANEFMDAYGDILFNLYGSTETGIVTLAKPADLRAAPGTIGRPVPGNEIRLLDDSRRDLGEGEVGELFVKNKLLVAGYHKDDGATKESMLDGFFSVGDLARRDRDNRFFIEGRKRDMVISGGVNVYPAEVEGAIEQHPDVAECAVVGVPDREWGERVRAFVVKRAGSSLDEGTLKLFVRERLAGAKVPREFVFLDALPRNPTGKVLKRELRNIEVHPSA